MFRFRTSMSDRRRRGIRLCAALLALALLAPGCTPPLPEPTYGETVDYAALKNVQTINLQLYFKSPYGYALTTEARTLRISGVSWAEAALKELVKGPQGKGTEASLPKGTTIERVVVTGRMASVYLGGAFGAMNIEDELAARVAVTNTLCGFSDIEYVAIFGGRVQEGVRMPVMLSRYTGTLSSLLNTAKEAGENTDWVDVPLYFMDARGMFLLPEVRNCRANGQNIVGVVLQELMKGPTNTAAQLPVIAPNIMLPSEPKIKGNADGTKTAVISLSAPPGGDDLYIAKGYEVLPYAAIAFSITGCMPDVRSVAFEVNGERVRRIGTTDLGKNGLITRERFMAFEGQGVTLYFPDESMETLLPVVRAMTPEDAALPAKWLEALISGPLAHEDERAWPVIPSGIVPDDILGVTVNEELAVINLSRHFADVCARKAVGLREESALVYSIINTLTGLSGVKRVQFLVEGKQADTLGGSIVIRGPLMRNAGLIE